MRHDDLQDGELMSLDGELLLRGAVRITRGLSLRFWHGQFVQYEGRPDFDLRPGPYLLRHGTNVDRVALKRPFAHRYSQTVAPPRVVFTSMVEAASSAGH